MKTNFTFVMQIVLSSADEFDFRLENPPTATRVSSLVFKPSKLFCHHTIFFICMHLLLFHKLLRQKYKT